MPVEEAPEYRSPKRCLALSFRLSRDRWKAKAGLRLATIRSPRVRERDLSAGRDLWKRKALYYEDLLRAAGRLPAGTLPVPLDPLPPRADAPEPAPTSLERKRPRRG